MNRWLNCKFTFKEMNNTAEELQICIAVGILKTKVPFKYFPNDYATTTNQYKYNEYNVKSHTQFIIQLPNKRHPFQIFI